MSTSNNFEPRVRINADQRLATLEDGTVVIQPNVVPRKDLLVARDETPIKGEGRNCVPPPRD